MNTTSSSEGGDPLQEARAYNRSIYLMAGMPYLLLGIVGFKVYRELKKRAAKPAQTDSGGLDPTLGEPPA
jgi:hypothetical protein